MLVAKESKRLLLVIAFPSIFSANKTETKTKDVKSKLLLGKMKERKKESQEYFH